jgi:hypothetical protein
LNFKKKPKRQKLREPSRIIEKTEKNREKKPKRPK